MRCPSSPHSKFYPHIIMHSFNCFAAMKFGILYRRNVQLLRRYLREGGEKQTDCLNDLLLVNNFHCVLKAMKRWTFWCDRWGTPEVGTTAVGHFCNLNACSSAMHHLMYMWQSKYVGFPASLQFFEWRRISGCICGLCKTYISVSYTHLTLPTIYSV